MRDYKNYRIWGEGLDLFAVIYQTTKGFPKEERYGLSSQMRRSALSISSNIAEGCGRYSNKEFARFLEISLGSIHELDTQVQACKRVGLINESEPVIDTRILNLKRQLISLIKKVKMEIK